MSAGIQSDFTLRTTPRFNDGVCLVANAVQDSVLVFRGAACIYEDMFGGFFDHDAGQTLMSDFGDRRVVDTTEPDTRSVAGAEDKVQQIAKWKDVFEGKAVTFLTELSRIHIMGEDIRLGAEAVRRSTGKPCIAASAKWIVRDYSDAVQSLLAGMAAEALAAGPPEVRPGTVGLVGYAFWRNEGDAQGDVAELRRLAAGAGLEPCPVWLSSGRWQELQELCSAATLLAFPDGMGAAERIAAVSGARVHASHLPISLRQCREWMQTLAGVGADSAKVRAFVDAELRRVVPLLDLFVRRELLGRRALVVATREWLPGIVACLSEDLGLQIAGAICRSRKDPAGSGLQPDDPARAFDPSEASLRYHVGRAIEQGGLDLIVGSAWERRVLAPEHHDIPFVEFGYPQLRSHFLQPTPHLGFSGVLTWAQRLHDAMAHARPGNGARG